jgi:hypothetical protein
MTKTQNFSNAHAQYSSGAPSIFTFFSNARIFILISMSNHSRQCKIKCQQDGEGFHGTVPLIPVMQGAA